MKENQREEETLELGRDHLGPSQSPSRSGSHAGVRVSAELCAVKKLFVLLVFTAGASSEAVVQNLAYVSLAPLPLTFIMVL